MSKIKLFDPFLDGSEKNAINQVLDSHFWASGAGTGYVGKFEEKFSKYVGSKNSIAVNSGTAALNLALSMFDIKNKEVILPSLSFVSTAHAVILNGGIPIFADIDSQTLCIDPIQIKKLISKKTKIILPVHFAGLPANLYEIKKICKENNLYLIEDAAHASGSSYQNKKIGRHGDLVCFSFHPVKNLAMPTGGLISINTKNYKKISTILKEKRWCGISNRKGITYDVKNVGWNYYMNEFSAAIGIEQLKKLDNLNNVRKKIAKLYNKKINLEHKMMYDENSSYHIFWIRVKKRNQFRKKMSNVGIETGIHYKPIHTFSMYAKNNTLPITEKIANEIVSIPIHPNLSDDEIEKIINSVNKFS
ncbi:DegT/DnrJ/EryC1/StrS family aminotransferase [Nitrosopumilus ureiphilus]|uniref:Glutamine--scyllo-inositol aminotransferase n=1 Tax=Nitrosopumilus ureiphilus TaxID=1470067 RepID=A0A7D5RCK6_9ARCH|nr:DegT/DnrJ/EryC1/StrS family aminotransferase [Nitrosopumilus ureiphilus]QLH05763.1 glutamine--scyllo-inositol aminotransferase [Nitrosopumilus ureiphilus]